MALAPDPRSGPASERTKRRRPTASLSRRLRRSLPATAEVSAQERIVGRSGHRWTLDVSVRHRLSGRTVLMMFDCKWHVRGISLNYVEAVSTMRDDVGADVAFIISNSGFTRGARYLARRNGILLFRLNDALETDWHALIGTDAWRGSLGALDQASEVG